MRGEIRGEMLGEMRGQMRGQMRGEMRGERGEIRGAHSSRVLATASRRRELLSTPDTGNAATCRISNALG